MSNIEIRQTLGRVGLLVDVHRYDEARQELHDALASDPDSAVLLTELAAVELSNGRPSVALRAAERALAADPMNERNSRILSAALRRLDRDREALVAARNAVTLAPNFPEAHLSVSSAYLGLMQFEKAEEAARRALELRPQYTSAQRQLAEIRLVNKDSAGALAIYYDILKRSPQDAKSMDGIGRALWDDGRREEARAFFARASMADPRNVQSRSHLVASVGRFAIPGSFFVIYVLIRVVSAVGHQWGFAVGGAAVLLVVATAWLWKRRNTRRDLATLEPHVADYVSSELARRRFRRTWLANQKARWADRSSLGSIVRLTINYARFDFRRRDGFFRKASWLFWFVMMLIALYFVGAIVIFLLAKAMSGILALVTN